MEGKFTGNLLGQDVKNDEDSKDQHNTTQYSLSLVQLAVQVVINGADSCRNEPVEVQRLAARLRLSRPSA